MTQWTHSAERVLRLSPGIHVLPILHANGDMAQEVRETLIARSFDCLAVPLPPSVEPALEQAVDRLPAVSLVVQPEPEQEGQPVCTYVPVDPCQAVIMGIRVATGEGIARAYIDREVAVYEPTPFTSPDPHALKRVGAAAFASALVPSLVPPSQSGQRWDRITWMAFQLHRLELEYRAILCLCPLPDWPWLRLAYQERRPYHSPERLSGNPSLHLVTPPSLYFVLGELPFITELYERRRAQARSDEHLAVDGVKELLLDARRRWLAERDRGGMQESNWLTPQVLQRYLQYVRNLTLLDRRLTPDLYTLVLAAKQVAGDTFAVTLLETAKQYAYQEDPVGFTGQPPLAVGLGKVEMPDGQVSLAKNRLEGHPRYWRSLPLTPRPQRRTSRRWAYQWNPFRQCSWPPEDSRIESFNAHIREQARAILGADLARVEKFSTSIKDGIDLRETLRRRHTQRDRSSRTDIYVKEIPPARGNVEAVIFLFDTPADPEVYDWRATWQAEHAEESTLCFYATPFLEQMVGPGIGQSRYGGALFLFPPRPIRDIWEDDAFHMARTLEERLIAGAAAYSREPHVALVSPIPPRARWRQLARHFQRRLVYIPLRRFSGQMIDRLRHFHVLNGHEIRSFAASYIRES